MINATQVAALWFKNDQTVMLLVVDFAITVNTADRFVSVDITCESDYNDNSPVFDIFMQKQAVDINLVVRDNSLGTKRTIKFENALINSYLETYDSQQISYENRNVYFIEFSIHADSVNLGHTSFSPAA